MKHFMYFLFVLVCGCPGRMKLGYHDVTLERDAPKESVKVDDEGHVVEEDVAEMPCGDGPPLIAEIDPCGMYEQDIGDVCTAASGGNISFRFSTTAACTAEVVCQESPNSPATYYEHEQRNALDHHVVLRDLPTGGILMCDIFCHCPYGENVEMLLGGVGMFVPGDSGVRITEVLINPRGPEPQQEFVEIVNITGFPLDISGWRLGDVPPPACAGDGGCEELLDGYGDAIPGGTVIPFLVPVLLVPEGFDENDGSDAVVPGDCTLIRLDASLADRGLRNTRGEPVFLVDRDGEVASLYPNALGVPDQGFSAERVHLDYPDEDVLNWMESPSGVPSPCEY